MSMFSLTGKWYMSVCGTRNVTLLIVFFTLLTVQFIGRCTTLCCLWVLTNWLIAYSLKTLKATEVLTLFATTTSFLYLLSWVVLHQQFVGLRVSQFFTLLYITSQFHFKSILPFFYVIILIRKKFSLCLKCDLTLTQTGIF